MMNLKVSTRFVTSIATIFTLFSASEVLAGSLNLSDFSDISSLTLNGNAQQVDDVLRVTSSAPYQRGSAFVTDPLTLANEASFSSFFQFRISNPGGASDEDGQGADGLAFVVQTVSNTAGGSGGGIGYGGLSNSVGIEFDTWDNSIVDGVLDPNGNHIGIDLDGNINSVLVTPVAPILNNGSVYSAWVDYDGLNDVLEVRFNTTSVRPIAPLLSLDVNLVDVLGSPNAFVGFTSGTGGGFNDHDILSFMIDDFDPISDPTATPEPESLIFLGTAAALGLSGIMKRKFSKKVNPSLEFA